MAVQRTAKGKRIVGASTEFHLRLLATLARYAIAYGFASPVNDVNAQIRNGPTCVRVAVFSTVQGEAKHFLRAAIFIKNGYYPFGYDLPEFGSFLYEALPAMA